jgi:tetratricopeptide (TPR) repeat protein
MDCRHTRRWFSAVGARLTWPLASGLLLGVGCVHDQDLPVTAQVNPAAMVNADKVKEKDLPRRLPSASTCLAFGDFHLKAALTGDCTPAQKQQLFDQARKSYQQTLKLDAKCVDAYLGLARAYDYLGVYDRALATYADGMKVLPKEATLRFELGMCQARHKEMEPALENLRLATTMDPDNRAFATTYGYALARAGRYDDSVAAFKKVVSEAQAHYNLARMLHHLKDDAASKQQLQLALQADPKLTPAQQLLTELENPSAAATTSGSASRGVGGNGQPGVERASPSAIEARPVNRS